MEVAASSGARPALKQKGASDQRGLGCAQMLSPYTGRRVCGRIAGVRPSDGRVRSRYGDGSRRAVDQSACREARPGRRPVARPPTSAMPFEEKDTRPTPPRGNRQGTHTPGATCKNSRAGDGPDFRLRPAHSSCMSAGVHATHPAIPRTVPTVNVRGASPRCALRGSRRNGAPDPLAANAATRDSAPFSADDSRAPPVTSRAPARSTPCSQRAGARPRRRLILPAARRDGLGRHAAQRRTFTSRRMGGSRHEVGTRRPGRVHTVQVWVRRLRHCPQATGQCHGRWLYGLGVHRTWGGTVGSTT